MIMAQHPQASPKSHHQAPATRQQATNDNRLPQAQQHLEAKNIYNIDRTHQQQQFEQDNKRTLIKNQLYLIEQLQLENANLRNERDQLQLENEELKFQLQMISSSNILTQPGATFSNNQPLDKIVENDNNIKSNANNNHLSGIGNFRTVPTNCAPVDIISVAHNNQNQKQIKLLATPLRQAGYNCKNTIANIPNSNDNYHLISLTNAKTTTRNPLDTQQASVRATLTSTASLNDCRISNYDRGGGGGGLGEAIILGEAGELIGKSLAGKSTTLIPFNVRTVANSTYPQSRSLPHDDDEQAALKLVEQQYGDSDLVQASAIIIQRAFRKYQICKRFRTITEQLRLTTRSASAASQQQDDTLTEDLPYASGTTRAAAWESLSQAASRLAEAAAAAKQQQQVAASLNGTTTTTTRPISTTLNNANTNNKHQQQAANNIVNPITTASAQPIVRNKQHDPVVAAAINFQQLESIRKRQYRVGLNIFNKSPEKGVSFLIAHSFIDSTSPYTKTSTSYYHSNQLHFIDSKQHHHHQLMQQLALPPQITTHSSTNCSPTPMPACQICVEEENLKRNVAHFLLHRKGLAKEKIGQYLGNLQAPFNQDVLKYYLQELDFNGLQIDLALRKFLSTFRLPGEAQKIERIVDNFAQRYVQCQQQQTATTTTLTTNTSNGNIVQQIQLTTTNNIQEQQTNNSNCNNKQQNVNNNYKNNLILLSKDEIFILTFAIIMLNTDLHSPSLKPTSRMSSIQFVNNLRGVFKSQNINENDLVEIYERVKANQITTTPDHVNHVMKVQQGLTVTNFQKKELPNLCLPHRRLVCFCRLFEVYDVNKKERVGQHQREIFLFNDLLLVTKIARRVRANTTQLYAYRQSISLQGLYVQLFQTTNYNFGIRLCQRSNDETIIMFNARNELDQSRFVDDLGESIAEMDEMETIRAHNIIETIHFKHLERLRRHSMMHNSNENCCSLLNDDNQQQQEKSGKLKLNYMINTCDTRININTNTNTNIKEQQQKLITVQATTEVEKEQQSIIKQQQQQKQRHKQNGNSNCANKPTTTATTPASDVASNSISCRFQAKFSSMLNLSSVALTGGQSAGATDNTSADRSKGLRHNQSFVIQPSHQISTHNNASNRAPEGQEAISNMIGDPGFQSNEVRQQQQQQHPMQQRRSNSTNSVHSLDSGLFLSRDVSPNQSS